MEEDTPQHKKALEINQEGEIITLPGKGNNHCWTNDYFPFLVEEVGLLKICHH